MIFEKYIRVGYAGLTNAELIELDNEIRIIQNQIKIELQMNKTRGL